VCESSDRVERVNGTIVTEPQELFQDFRRPLFAVKAGDVELVPPRLAASRRAL